MSKKDCCVDLVEELMQLRKRNQELELLLKEKLTTPDFPKENTFQKDKKTYIKYVNECNLLAEKDMQILTLEGINRIFKAALSKNEEDLGRTCLKVALELTKSCVGFIGEINAEGYLNKIIISYPEWKVKKLTHNGMPESLKEHGIYSRVINEGKSIFINGLPQHLNCKAPEGHAGINNFLGTPLIENEKVVGIVGLSNKDGGYNEKDIQLVEALTPAIVQAIMRQQTELTLRESEERFRKIVTTANEGIAMIDAQGKVTFVNDILAKWLGYQVEEIVGREIYNFVPFDVKTGSYNRFEKRKSGISERYDHKLRKKDGGYIWTIVSGTPLFDKDGQFLVDLAMYTDITERKQAEKALTEVVRTSENRARELNAVIEAMPDGLVIYDETGCVTYINEIAKRIFNEFRTDVNKNFKDRVEEGQAYSLDGQGIVFEDTPLYRSLNKGEVVKDFALYFKNSLEQNIFVSMSCAPFRGDNGEITGAVATYKDITESKKAEQLLRDSEENARTLVEKLRKDDQNKNEFLSMLSHELRNPLASIMMSISLMKHVPPGGEEAAQARTIMERQATQLSRLVDDLLDVTRITRNIIELKKQKVELNGLVYRAVENYRKNFADIDVKLEMKLTSEPIILTADPVRFTQIVDNLLHNEVKFTRKGDTTLVTVEKDENTQEALIKVEDNGLGIEPRLLPDLFKPFMQVENTIDRSGGGLGLGLAIVKGMVELHGGNVEVYSEGLGFGTKFILRLPIPDNLDIQNTELQVSGQTIPSMRILVIDDIPDIAEIFSTLLTHLGHEVKTASNGREGLEVAKEFRPHALLCDIGLPGMTGYEVAESFRRNNQLKDVFLIALSGYAQPEDLAKARAAGFDRHLAKPVDLDTLKDALFEVPSIKNNLQI